jgi:hypothetical protein
VTFLLLEAQNSIINRVLECLNHVSMFCLVGEWGFSFVLGFCFVLPSPKNPLELEKL